MRTSASLYFTLCARVNEFQSTVPPLLLALCTLGLSATRAAYKREIQSAADPAAKEREIETRLYQLASPFRTAEATGQDIIDPRDTRMVCCEFAHTSKTKIQERIMNRRTCCSSRRCLSILIVDPRER